MSAAISERWARYGSMCREARISLGYASARSFCDALRLRMHLKMTKDVLYKVEQGRQVPKAELFIALNIALFGNPLPPNIAALFSGLRSSEVVE